MKGYLDCTKRDAAGWPFDSIKITRDQCVIFGQLWSPVKHKQATTLLRLPWSDLIWWTKTMSIHETHSVILAETSTCQPKPRDDPVKAC